MNFLIGIDLDSHNQLQLLKRFFNAKQIARVEVKQTQHGYHFRIFKRASIRQNLQLDIILEIAAGKWLGMRLKSINLTHQNGLIHYLKAKLQ